MNISLRNKLVKNKHLALNKMKYKTTPCQKPNCQCCGQISDKEHFKINGKTIRPAAGCCTTYNIIYCVQCNICQKNYVGRSVQRLNERIGQHRRSFYEILGNSSALTNDIYTKDDNYSLGIHLVKDHNMSKKSDFTNNYTVFLLETCSPVILEVQEHKFIQSLRSIRPHGLNSVDPFGIPLLRF